MATHPTTPHPLPKTSESPSLAQEDTLLLPGWQHLSDPLAEQLSPHALPILTEILIDAFQHQSNPSNTDD